MDSREWLENLTRHPALSHMLPMQVQPGLPMPFLRHGRLMLFVPFYNIRPFDGGIACSRTLFIAVFSLPARRIVRFEDLRALSGADGEEIFAAAPSDAALRRLRLAAEQLFLDLGGIERDFAAGSALERGRLDAYRERLFRALVIPEQKCMYEGIADDSHPGV
jgi:hypothetical protein